jgi:hypothetical protein
VQAFSRPSCLDFFDILENGTHDNADNNNNGEFRREKPFNTSIDRGR